MRESPASDVKRGRCKHAQEHPPRIADFDSNLGRSNVWIKNRADIADFAL